MEFTTLNNDNPVVIPAVEEKVYDKQWLSHIRINSTPNKATVIAHLVPYNGESVLAEPDEEIKIENIFEAMQDENRPAELRMMYAQVMELLLQTVKVEKAYIKEVARLEAERKEAERLENERLESERLEAERLARLEEERLAEEREIKRLAELARLAEEQRLLDEQNVEENITEEDTTDEEPTPEL
jgi:long-subunit acyl-CoA synthetase (AMP-forming)